MRKSLTLGVSTALLAVMTACTSTQSHHPVEAVYGPAPTMELQTPDDQTDENTSDGTSEDIVYGEPSRVSEVPAVYGPEPVRADDDSDDDNANDSDAKWDVNEPVIEGVYGPDPSWADDPEGSAEG